MAIFSARTLLCCLLIIVSITTLGCGYRVPYSSFNASEAAVTKPTSDLGNCNLYVGSWIHDDSFPLYDALQCPFISSRINCQKNGRPDSDYQKWRWSPQACNMPRFNGLDFLERIRGRRLLFVGDSISRNQWESMVCLLQGLIPDDRKSMVNQYPLLSFKALDYGVSVDFNWAPFLVEVDTNAQQQRVLKLDIIGPSGNFWKGADILVFESSHWWSHTGSEKSWDLIMEGGQVMSTMDPMEAYRRGLITWANWVLSNIDPTKSLVYFRSTSPKHFSPRLWNEGTGHRCYGQTEPVKEGELSVWEPQESRVLRDVLTQLEKMKFPVRVLDITEISEYRKDGHPSVYTSGLSQQERANPDQNADCSHWCLPGVPDSWNNILYASFLQQSLGLGEAGQYFGRGDVGLHCKSQVAWSFGIWLALMGLLS